MGFISKFYEHSDGYMIGMTKQGIEFSFDKEDFAKVSQYSYYVDDQGYIKTNQKFEGKNIFLHRLIMDAPNDMYVDHKFHDKTDNRRSKLRVCTVKENGANKLKRRDSKNQYKGVLWIEKRKKWRAKIWVDGKYVYRGYYSNEVDAAKAYNQLAIEHFGEFAYLNVV